MQSLGLFFHSLLKGLKRFIGLLPDAAVWVADDQRTRAGLSLSYDAAGRREYRLENYTHKHPHILWEDHHADVTASEAMAATKSPAARDEAKKFLTDTLANGPVSATGIQEAAKANGIAERTLYRAKGELGIRAEKKGQSGQWQWRLPETPKIATY